MFSLMHSSVTKYFRKVLFPTICELPDMYLSELKIWINLFHVATSETLKKSWKRKGYKNQCCDSGSPLSAKHLEHLFDPSTLQMQMFIFLTPMVSYKKGKIEITYWYVLNANNKWSGSLVYSNNPEPTLSSACGNQGTVSVNHTHYIILLIIQ